MKTGYIEPPDAEISRFPGLRLRYAALGDCDFFHGLCRLPDVLENLSGNREFKYETFVNYFVRRLNDERCRIIMAELDHESVGALTIEVRRGAGVGLISLALVPRARSRGLGSALAKAVSGFLIRDLKLRFMTAVVMRKNAPSRKCFMRAGFGPYQTLGDRDILVFCVEDRIKYLALVQARLSSQRLPGKVLLPLCGTPVIKHVVNRLEASGRIALTVVATSEDRSDDRLFEYCQSENIHVSRGPLENVLARYQKAALIFKPEHIVRITGDCPLIDSGLVDRLIDLYEESKPVDYLSNVGVKPEHRTFPRGLDTEIFTRKTLDLAHENAREPYELEHVTPHIYFNPDRFRLVFVKHPKDYSRFRLTLDEPADYELLKKIFARFKSERHVGWLKVANLLETRPDWCKINEKVEQKKAGQGDRMKDGKYAIKYLEG